MRGGRELILKWMGVIKMFTLGLFWPASRYFWLFHSAFLVIYPSQREKR